MTNSLSQLCNSSVTVTVIPIGYIDSMAGGGGAPGSRTTSSVSPTLATLYLKEKQRALSLAEWLTHSSSSTHPGQLDSLCR